MLNYLVLIFIYISSLNVSCLIFIHCVASVFFSSILQQYTSYRRLSALECFQRKKRKDALDGGEYVRTRPTGCHFLALTRAHEPPFSCTLAELNVRREQIFEYQFVLLTIHEHARPALNLAPNVGLHLALYTACFNSSLSLSLALNLSL